MLINTSTSCVRLHASPVRILCLCSLYTSHRPPPSISVSLGCIIPHTCQFRNLLDFSDSCHFSCTPTHVSCNTCNPATYLLGRTYLFAVCACLKLAIGIHWCNFSNSNQSMVNSLHMWVKHACWKRVQVLRLHSTALCSCGLDLIRRIIPV